MQCRPRQGRQPVGTSARLPKSRSRWSPGFANNTPLVRQLYRRTPLPPKSLDSRGRKTVVDCTTRMSLSWRACLWVCLLMVSAGCEYEPAPSPSAPSEPLAEQPAAAPPAKAGSEPPRADAPPGQPAAAAPSPAQAHPPRAGNPLRQPAEATPTRPQARPAMPKNPLRRLPAPEGRPPGSIRLSAGLALPQTGPTGIMMCFSVDYSFTSGGPNPSSQYVWVIERAKGDPWMQSRQLAKRGTLEVIIVGWRPEQRPFNTHVMEVSQYGSRRRVSPSASLR